MTSIHVPKVLLLSLIFLMTIHSEAQSASSDRRIVMYPNEDDQVFDAGATLTLTCIYNIRYNNVSGLNISWTVPDHNLDTDELVRNIFFLQFDTYVTKIYYLLKFLRDSLIFSFHAIRLQIKVHTDNEEDKEEDNINGRFESSSGRNTTHIWSTMILTHTEATDTGYYTCKGIGNFYDKSTIDLSRKKYVYFFGS